MNLFGWFRKEKENCVVETVKAHALLHETITKTIGSMISRIEELEAVSKEFKETKDKLPGMFQKFRNKFKNVRWRISKLEKKQHKPASEEALEERRLEDMSAEEAERAYNAACGYREPDWGSEEEPKCFQSGKSHLASDTNEEVADGITLQGASGIQYFVQLLKKQEEAEKLLEAQQRMINRLFRIANTTVIDPYKSITDDLRKAEKWKKTLKKKLKEFKEEKV